MKDCVCGQSVRADERFASDCWLPTERKGNFSCQIIKKETTATEKTAQVRSPGQSRSGQGMRMAGKRMVRETVRKIIADKITELITVRVIRIREIMDREIIRTGRAGGMVRMVRMFRVRKVTIPAVIKITRGIRDSGAMAGSYQNCQNPGYGTGHGQNAQNWGNDAPGNNQNWQGRGYGPCNQESYRGPGYGAGNGQNYYPGSQGYGEDMAGNRKKKKKKRRKSLFILELIILLILAVGVFACTRLARMEHISLKNILTNVGAASQDGYQNIVIYGVDSREGDLTTDAHSDTIIICSINKKTKDIKMVSVYRDTYLDNTNGEYRKATECYFFGLARSAPSIC